MGFLIKHIEKRVRKPRFRLRNILPEIAAISTLQI